MGAIEVRGPVKRYGDTTAVDGLDLEVNAGRVFALLGPNGADKTTTVEILEGHRTRTSGTASVLGMGPERMETGFSGNASGSSSCRRPSSRTCPSSA